MNVAVIPVLQRLNVRDSITIEYNVKKTLTDEIRCGKGSQAAFHSKSKRELMLLVSDFINFIINTGFDCAVEFLT